MTKRASPNCGKNYVLTVDEFDTVAELIESTANTCVDVAVENVAFYIGGMSEKEQKEHGKLVAEEFAKYVLTRLAQHMLTSPDALREVTEAITEEMNGWW